MPVEGQSRAPLGRRDKRVLAVIAVLAVGGGTAAGVTLATSSSPSNTGCLVAYTPSTLGGARVRTCGAAAHAFCRTQGKRDAAIAAACRKQGFAADVRGG